MYPDPITPKSYPELLQAVDYDPFDLMPGVLPAPPRVLTTTDKLQSVRCRIAEGNAIDCACFNNLIAACDLDRSLPDIANVDGKDTFQWLHGNAVNNALVFALNADDQYRERALGALRILATMYPEKKWGEFSGKTFIQFARAYDLQAAAGLSAEDDNLARAALWMIPSWLDPLSHRHCNNHNTFNIQGRLAAGIALGHRPFIHDALYGCERNGRWRYGLIHLLRHDILADGMQWEGAMGYHMLVLSGVFEAATLLENVGVDLWNRGFPSLAQNDGHDEHRGWGPKGKKYLNAGLDAMIYQALPGGDYSMLHDQVLGNLRGAGAWWPLMAKAWDVWDQPRYAWALKKSYEMRGDTNTPPPPWFSGEGQVTEFVRIMRRDEPDGDFSYADNAAISLCGSHRGGCSMFPVHGSTILRARPDSSDAPAAYLYWGPHWAGHRSPGSLHLDIHAGGNRVTQAPQLNLKGYSDPRHLTWGRTTIAHNTMTVDGQPMFPYDFETDSIWEMDTWRDRISDSSLIEFNPHGGDGIFKTVRVSNDNVYPGVLLDRTVVLADDLLVDVFRASSRRTHCYDWAMHCTGTFNPVDGAEPFDLGGERGYRHFKNAWRHPRMSGWVGLQPSGTPTPVTVALLLDEGRRLIVADDPVPDNRPGIGDAGAPPLRSTLIVRTQAECALNVSVWSLSGKTLEAVMQSVNNDGDLTLRTNVDGDANRWRFPMDGEVECLKCSGSGLKTAD